MRRVFTVATLGFICLLASAAAEQPRFDEGKLAEIPRRMEQLVSERQIAGAVTLVATKDRVVHLAAVGKADLASGRPMEPDTIFRVASMTKPITSTALMMLIEQGKLAVDDPVAKHIPAFAGQRLKDGGAARPVTIRDVVTHTAGLATSAGGDQERTLAETSEAIGRLPLEFPPESKWQYSSGITIAGRLIEIASGEG